MQLLIAGGKAAPVSRRLAYDILRTANVQQEDWVHVCEGLLVDVSPDSPADVHIRALELICHVPEPLLVSMYDQKDLQGKLLKCFLSVRALLALCTCILPAASGCLKLLHRCYSASCAWSASTALF